MSWVKVNGLLYYKGLAWTGLLRLFHYPSCGGTRQSGLVIHRLQCVDIIGNYCIPEDPACEQYKIFFSKPLADEPLAIWNGRNIHLTEQIGKESKYHGQDRIWLMQFRISYTFCFTDAKITKWEATFPHSFDYLNV